MAVLLTFINTKKLSVICIILTAILSIWAGKSISPTYILESVTLDVQKEDSSLYYVYKDKPTKIENPVPQSQSQLLTAQHNNFKTAPTINSEIITKKNPQNTDEFQLLTVKKHWSIWSLLPAFITILLCWLTREPLTALLAGIISGAFIMGKYQLIQDIFIPSLMTKNAATMILIYLIFLGGLLGIWSKTGAAKAFAEWMTKHFVKGPRSAKLVAWFLGVLFFQGGTISVVLVGSTVKPLSDKENVSHEELAYIVDSTASPIASQLAFNAWPAYIQAFIYVSGVSFLATETARIGFFFKSVPFCFYAIFAVLGTFLVAIEKPLFYGKKLSDALKRSRKTGQLDAKDAKPLGEPELEKTSIPKHYKPHLFEFLLPLTVLISTAIGTFILFGTPKITLAFGVALSIAFITALIKGMGLSDIIDGLVDGMKSLILGLIILLLAMTVGNITVETGTGLYLTQILGQHLPYWILPVCLQILTMCMAFSTGTSWGTYAVVFPIAMPLAWAVAMHHGVAHPELFMTLCFAAVMDGSVFGDQCSPISDTTVLSSMCTGCDLMDHVKTQIPQASFAALMAGICWTAVTLVFV